MPNPWDKYLASAPQPDNPLPARIKLELDGELFAFVLTSPERSVAKSDLPIIGSHELDVLRRATPAQPIPAETAKAVLRIKRVLGGEVINATLPPSSRKARRPT